MKTVVVLHSSYGFHTENEFAGIMCAAKCRDWNVQTVVADLSQTRAEWHRRLVMEVSIWRPDGIIADWHHGLASFVYSRREFRDVPIVAWDGEPNMLPQGLVCVYSDYEKIAAEAVGELIGTGFRNFAYVPMCGNPSWSALRERSVVRQLSDYGRRVSRPPDVSARIDAVAYGDVLKDFLASLPCPCAVFAANDLVAARVVSVCRELGIAIPDEMAVLGVDDDKMTCENTIPTLSSIRSNYEEGGYAAAELLDRMMTHPRSKHPSVAFGTIGVLRRASTTVLRRPDARVVKALELIRAQACEGLDISAVVAFMGGSRRNAEVLFRKCTGCTILESILRVRIDRLKRFLLERNRMIKVLPDLCGFNSHVDMCRAFKRFERCTPTEWRLKHGIGSR